MPNIMIWRIWLFCFLMVSVLTQMSFVRTNYTVSPNYAKSVSSLYTFTFNVYNAVTGTMNLRVDFPNNFILSTATNCQVKLGATVVSGTVCSFDPTTNQVVINNIVIASTFSTLEVQFRTATSKYSATSTVQFAFYNGTSSALITNNPEMILIENALMTCSLTSNTTVVGAATVYTVTYQPSVEIEAGSVVQLLFDPWGPFLRSNFLSTNTTSVCAGQCTISLLPSFGVELMVFSSLYSSASNSSNSLALSNARNPASFAPIALKLIVSASDGSSVYMTGSTTFAASTPNTFNGVTFDLPVKTISATNPNINLRLTLKNPLNSNTYLRVIYPSQISCSFLYAFNSLSNVVTEITGQASGQLLLGGLARSTITSQPTLISIGNFTLVNPPFSQKSVAITFRTEQLINSTYYFIDETTVQVTSTASTITQAAVKAQVANIGSVTTYELWFVTVNRLIPGSFVVVTFPSETVLSTTESTCSLTNTAITSRCSITSPTSLKINLDSIAVASTNFTLTVTKVTNPLLTSPSSSFTIKTFYSDDTTLVDQLTSSLTIKATEVPLRSVTVTPGSFLVNARTPYTFNLQTTYEIPTSSIVKVYFPNELNDGVQTLQSFVIDGAAVSGCLLTVSNSSYVEFSNLCIKTSVRNTSTITITLANVLNPSSFKPTGSFTVEIYNGVYKQEYLNTGILVTMNQTAAIPYFNVTPTSTTANDVNMYTFEINFQIKRFSGDRILIKFPSDVPLSNTYDCASLTSNMTISCTKTNSDTLLFVLNFISTVYPSQSIKFTVQNFTNMWYATTRTFTAQTTTNDTTYYYQEEGPGIVNYQPAKITATINNDNNIVLLSDSKVVVGLSSPFALTKATNASQLFIVMQVPTDLVPKNGTCVPSYGSSTCAQTSTQTFNITGISDFSSNLNVRFTATTSFFETSSAFDIKLYYGSYLVQSNSELKAQRYCQSPCKQCTAVKTECISCLQSPYASQTIYFSFNSSCVTSCPDTYFLNSSTKSCGKCSSSVCQNCVNSETQCTSCPANKYLFNKTCLSVCPEGFYAFNAECLVCSSPCRTCAGQGTSCLSCASGFFLDYGSNTSRCVRTCTNPNYLGLDGQCKQCTSNCLTCEVTLSNCTSCNQTVYLFYQNTCIRACPVGMYSNANGACTACVQPCLTCSTRVNCESCMANYYLFSGGSCVAQCPNGYIEVVNECVTCDSKCATCDVTVGNCTSCPSGSYFYQNDCYTTCPALTYPYNKTCTRCIEPCVTCSNSPEVCLSCIDGLLLLNSTCVTACPLSGYIEEDSKCLSCPSNCTTCESSISCTLCSNDYFLLQGGCVSSCPVNYPIVTNRQCEKCDDVCLTCQTAKQNCTSCKINYFKHLYTCMESCPIGYYSNVKNYECQDGLSSKIVFFPILILSIIVMVFVCVVKCLNPSTALPTSLVSLLSLTEMAIWVYMIVQLAQPFKELNMDYTLPIGMNIVALACLIVQNVAFFFLEYKKMEQDDYVRGWAMNNVNYSVLMIHRYVGLVLNFKFFRFCYSRFFSIRTLSLPFKTNENIFPLTTVFSILNFILCQVPMMVCSFSLVYKKLNRDQLFYTSIECLILTITCAVILLIDIFKSEEFFEESDYVKTRKYLEKIKDASFNQLEDHLDITHNEGSIEGEKYVSKTGGKFIWSKEEPGSLKELFFQQEAGSAMTDAMETITAQGQYNKGKAFNGHQQKKGRRINIFDPIKEQDEELYEDLKFSESQVKTQAQLEAQREGSMNVHRQYDHAISYEQQKTRRLQEFGVNTDELSNWDDTMSMIEQRPLKQKWNSIIGHRQQLAKSIFNTFDEYSTKQLQKFIEPIDQEEDGEDEQRHYNNNRRMMEDPFRTTEYGKVRKTKRRKRKMLNQAPPGNNELEKIYLQRLTEKKKYKDIFASSQSIKYDF